MSASKKIWINAVFVLISIQLVAAANIQTITGDLRLPNGTINASGTIYTPQICLSGSCRTSWPNGSGGNLSSSGTTGYIALFQNNTFLNNSMIYQNESNLAFGTKIYIDNNTRVGINTNTPSIYHMLDVNGTIHSNGITSLGNIRIDSAALTFSGVDSNAKTVMTYGYDLYIGSPGVSGGGGNIIFQTQNTTYGTVVSRMIIKNETGYVGIGTQTPTTMLDVNGSVNISSGNLSVNSGRITIGNPDSNASLAIKRVDDGRTMILGRAISSGSGDTGKFIDYQNAINDTIFSVSGQGATYSSSGYASSEFGSFGFSGNWGYFRPAASYTLITSDQAPLGLQLSGYNVTINTSNTNILGNVSAPRICLAGDCRTTWPSSAADGTGGWTNTSTGTTTNLDVYVKNTSGGTRFYTNSTSGQTQISAIGSTAPVLQITGANSDPQTGMTPLGVVRVIGSSFNNALDLGVRSASPYGGWIQVLDVTGPSTKYPLYLNPDGGSVSIGSYISTQAFDVNGSANFSGTNAKVWINGSEVCTATNGLCGTGTADGTGGWTNTSSYTRSKGLDVNITNSTGSSIMYVNSSSRRVSIGTADANAYHSLTVDGGIYVSGFTVTSPTGVLAGDAYGGGLMLLGADANRKTIISINTTNDLSITSPDNSLGITYNANHQNASHKFQINNTEAMRIDNQGRIGIGTTTPVATLDVRGAVNVSGQINASSINIPAGNYLKFGGSNTFTVDGSGTTIIEKEAVTFVLRSGAWYDFIVTNAGLTGIGVQSPSASLDVAGNQYATYDMRVNNTLYIQNGRVGIGTNNASQKLDVNGSINISGTSSKLYTPEICLAGSCQTSWPTNTGGNLSSNGITGYIPLYQNNTLLNNSMIYQSQTDLALGTKIFIYNNSRVGINTNNPNQFFLLDVNGSANIDGLNIDGNLRIGGNAYEIQLTGTDANSKKILSYPNNDLVISSPGVNGGGGNIIFQTKNSSNILETTAYLSNATGNFGLGTANPQAKLDVNGSAIIQQNLTVTGTNTTVKNLTADAIIFTGDAVNHRIYDNSSCIVFQAGTTTFSVCE